MNDNVNNDNRYNAKKLKSPLHQLKKLVRMLVKKPANTYKNYQDSEIEDNIANELLENSIFEEMDGCEDDAAVEVYFEGRRHLLPISKGQRYIPVHFARTQAGTFFWTTTSTADCDIDCHGDKNAITNYQLPELQVPAFRWAQA